MIHRVAHMFWTGGPMSYLRFLTIATFRKQNPEWAIHLHVGKYPCKRPEYPEPPHSVIYHGLMDWLPAAKRLATHVREWDLEEIGFKRNAWASFKADYLRWHLLADEGGFWTDMDVVYFMPLDESHFEGQDFAITMDDFAYYIAYIYAQPKSKRAGEILQMASEAYNPKEYQSIGAAMLQRAWPDRRVFTGKAGIRAIPPVVQLPVMWHKLPLLYKTDWDVPTENSVGVHWFGGHALSTVWENLLTPATLEYYNVALTRVIKRALEGETHAVDTVIVPDPSLPQGHPGTGGSGQPDGQCDAQERGQRGGGDCDGHQAVQESPEETEVPEEVA